MRASPFNFCIFFPFPLLTSNSSIARLSFRPPGWGWGEWLDFHHPKGRSFSQNPFPGGYSDVQIPGKTRYENRDQWKWTLAASTPQLDARVNAGVHCHCTALRDWPIATSYNRCKASSLIPNQVKGKGLDSFCCKSKLGLNRIKINFRSESTKSDCATK